MGKTNQFVTLLLIVAFTSSGLMTIYSASGATTPSIPEFNVEVVDKSYYVPVTYGVDPYTGKNITTGGGYTVDNRTLVFTIKNQPFTPYTNAEGKQINLFYHVNVKGHYVDTWGDLFEFINASDAEYTVGSYVMGEHAINSILIGVRNGDEIDFQVEAQIGYYNRSYINFYQYYNVFTGETSGWSETKTVTIGENKPTATPTINPTSIPSGTIQPTQTPTVDANQSIFQGTVAFGLTWEHIAIAVLCIIVAVLTVILFFSRKRSSEKTIGEK